MGSTQGGAIAVVQKERFMELTLNLTWLVLTALMCGLWVRYAPLKGASWRAQVVALALVLLILFPVISVTDDLIFAQNPAETDSLQRKGQAVENANGAPHPVLSFILSTIAEPVSESAKFMQQGQLPVLKAMVPAMGSIQNRPPPAA